MLKKLLFLLLSLFFTCSFSAADRYWVGGAGSWHDSRHWSQSSGGKGGAFIPSLSDDVIFDSNSFTAPGEKVSISGMALCRSFKSINPEYNMLLGNTGAEFFIAGSFTLDRQTTYSFRGTTHFVSTKKNNTLDFAGNPVNGNVIFNGTGSWTLKDNLVLDPRHTLHFVSGELYSNGKNIQCGTLDISGESPKKITLEKSLMIIHNGQVPSGKGSFKLIQNKSRIHVNHPLLSISQQKKGNDGGITVLDSVHYTITIPTCNNPSEGPFQDGSILVTAIFPVGPGPYGFEWSGGTLGATTFGNPLTGIGGGVYLLTVTDSSDGSQFQVFIIVTPPPPLGLTFTKKKPTCFNDCNGWITVNPVGGTPAYTYSWSNGQTAQTSTGMCVTGFISVKLTDKNGCNKTFSTSLTQPNLLSVTGAATDALCNGQCNGTATANPAGGTTTNYTYAWLPGGQTTKSISTLCVGTYTVTVRDDSSCVATTSVTVAQPVVLTTTISKADATCNASCNGSATANPAGGTAAYTYAWLPGGQTTQTINGLCAGTYTVNITDANSCRTSAIVSITQPNSLGVTTTATSLNCAGDCNASANSSIVGGTAPYTYAWLPGGETTSSISGLCAGAYTVSVTDANNCQATASVTVTIPPALNVALNIINPTCNSQCNGSITAVPAGGSSPYLYSWSPGGEITATISNLCIGSFTITVTDAKGCTNSASVNISEPVPINVNTTGTDVSCSGGCNGTATANPSGGTGVYAYLWLPGGQTTKTVTGLCAGVYSVRVTDANGCQATQNITITQPNLLIATITQSTSSCAVCTGTATVNASGGAAPYTYLWMPGGQTTPTATGLCVTSYTITVTDSSGCIARNVVNIQQVVNITVTNSSTNLSCFGACDGAATANPLGGTLPYTYAWQAGGQITPSITGLCAGSYTVTVTDANGCFNTSTTAFANPPLLTTTSSKTDISCNGLCNGTATSNPVGGTGAYTYLWMPGSQSTKTASGLCAGSYTVTVNDVNGCTTNTTVTITEPTIINDNEIVVNANCNQNDGGITLAPSGGVSPYAYSWSPGGQTTSSITNIPAGVYTVTITDTRGCTSSFAITVNNIGGPTLTSTVTPTTCFGSCNGTGSIGISGGTGPFSYLWVPGGQTISSVSSLCAGIYNVRVTDAGSGCIKFAAVTITEPAAFSANPTLTNATCNGACNGSISLSASGGTPGYAYAWLPGGLTTPSISNLCANTYSVIITDSRSCSTSLTFTVTQAPALNIAMTFTNVPCNGNCQGAATATISGGTPTYNYLWAPGGELIQSIANKCAATYTLTVTDINNCTARQTVTITEPLVLNSNMVSKNIDCKNACNGSARIIGSGGTLPYTYLWTPGSMTTDTVDNLCAGAYSVTMNDAKGCVTIRSVIITEPASILTATLTAVSPLCNNGCNGSAAATPAGGTGPYVYLWSGGQTSQTITGLCSGNYSITITDAKGCALGQSVTISDPPVLFSNASSTSPACVGDCNGSVNSLPAGGVSPYTYSWLPGGQTTPSVSGLCAGSYTIMTTDKNGCQDSQTVPVTNPGSFTILPSFAPANCGVCNGSLSVAPAGGTAPYTYAWLPGGQTTQSVTGLCAGTYTVTITDKNNCDTTITLALNNSGGPTGEVVVTTHNTCNGMCVGTGTVTPIGGNAPYAYLWNDPLAQATQSASGLCAGNYSVQVTDAQGCIHFSPVTITQPNVLTYNPAIVKNTCTGMCDASITLSASGGTPGYNYAWLPGGQITPGISNLCSGTYSISITDSRGCITSTSYTVTPTNTLAATISKTDISCNAICTGTGTVNVTTGTAPYTYLWSDPLGQTNSIATGLCAGTYSVTVSNAIGCNLTQNITINSATPITANPTVVSATCNACDGQISLAPSGGTGPYTYLWGSGQTSSSISNLCAGVYTVKITDALGCTLNTNIAVSNAAGPAVNTNINSTPACFGMCNGSATLVPAGGTAPYNYLWVQGGQTTATVTGLCAGTYNVQVSDATGCITTTTVTITSPPQITDNRTLINATCTLCNGSISLNPTGGTAPYVYAWSGGQTTPAISSLCARTYSVTITDNAGCAQTYQIPVSNPGSLSGNVNSTFLNCNNPCSGTASVVITSGTGPFTYSWSSGGTTSSVSGLCAGTYNVLVTDAAGCSKAIVFTMNPNTPLSFSTPVLSQISCASNCNGVANAIPSGGTLPYVYLWSPGGQTTSSATALCPNTYTITVTDGSGCSATQSVNITSPPLLMLDSNVINSSCNTLNDGSIDVIVNGGTPPYTYLWSPGGQTIEDLTGLLPGVYKIVVTDARRCKDSLTINLISNTIVLSNAGPDDTLCVGSSTLLNGGLSIGATTYSWYQLPNIITTIATTPTVTVSPAGTATTSYVLIVSNSICSDTDTVVIYLSQPFADAGPGSTILTGASTPIGGNPTGPAGASYFWIPSTGLSNPNAANPTANPTVTTSYTVVVTDAKGCTASDEVVVRILPQIIIPNGISPNKDGTNDKWIIDNIELFPQCLVEVYNRWGELLFSSPGYVEQWDGMYKGKDLPVGTYYYIINLNHPMYPEPYTGPITILR